jgi:cation:H+ antiporter
VDYLYLVGGLIGLFFGGEALVRGSVGIARRMAIPPLLIGLTVVGFGTSTPELLVSVDAAWRGVPDIALGNIVGSNIFNVLGILGVTALIAPIPVASRFLTFDLPVMIAVSLVLTALLLTRPVIGRGVGVAMLAGYVAYVWAAQG